jgi:hypothetical protein
LLTLPTERQLRRYCGIDDKEFGVTTLIKQRIQLQVQSLGPEERHGSLQIDEMHVQENLKYDKNND